MTTDDRLDRIIALLEQLVERKAKRKAPVAVDADTKLSLQQFTLAHTGKFSAPEIAELAGLPRNMATYLAISAVFEQMGVRKARTSKGRFYYIE